MTKTTLALIHRSYQEALVESNNLLSIAENLYNKLYDLEVCEEDSETFDAFVDGLRACIEVRKKTFEITNLVTYLNISMMYIVIWLNACKDCKIDMNWYGRRKSLESELTKLLAKSTFSNESVNIHDVFGLRGIILSDIPDEQAKEYIFEIYHSISGILAGKNRKFREEFINWLTNSNIDIVNKSVVNQVLSLPFAISNIRDYINTPKPNNYQSFQFTLTTPLYSQILPGCQLEVQLRSIKMHHEAEFGSASHSTYKLHGGNPDKLITEEDLAIKNIFKVDDFSKLHIYGFTSYDCIENDLDGIHFPKKLSNRRISDTLVFV